MGGPCQVCRCCRHGSFSRPSVHGDGRVTLRIRLPAPDGRFPGVLPVLLHDPVCGRLLRNCWPWLRHNLRPFRDDCGSMPGVCTACFENIHKGTEPHIKRGPVKRPFYHSDACDGVLLHQHGRGACCTRDRLLGLDTQLPVRALVHDCMAACVRTCMGGDCSKGSPHWTSPSHCGEA